MPACTSAGRSSAVADRLRIVAAACSCTLRSELFRSSVSMGTHPSLTCTQPHVSQSHQWTPTPLRSSHSLYTRDEAPDKCRI